MTNQNHKDIPSCLGFWSPSSDGDDFDYDCEYEPDFACDVCICITSEHDDYTGYDPRTGEPFNGSETRCIEIGEIECP